MFIKYLFLFCYQYRSHWWRISLDCETCLGLSCLCMSQNIQPEVPREGKNNFSHCPVLSYHVWLQIRRQSLNLLANIEQSFVNECTVSCVILGARPEAQLARRKFSLLLTGDLAFLSFGFRLSKLGQQYLSVTNLVVARYITHTKHITESCVSVS